MLLRRTATDVIQALQNCCCQTQRQIADFHAMIEYGHDHEEGAAKAADFRTDDDVVFPHTFQQLAQAALVYLFGAADGLADPFVHLQVVFLAESFDFVALVLDRLAVGAYANISVYHFFTPNIRKVRGNPYLCPYQELSG